jgi:hypothetical protein
MTGSIVIAINILPFWGWSPQNTDPLEDGRTEQRQCKELRILLAIDHQGC